MYSGLAEAFGIYMSLQFIICYLSQYPLIYHVNAKISVYCNNQGIIDCLNNTPSLIYPRDMLSNDYPIYQEIHSTSITHLNPLTIKFFHVNSHLDTKKPKHPPTTAEILNIDCNKQELQHAQTHPPLPNASNPLLDHSYPHLWVDTQIIYHHLQHVLWDAATNKEYFQYLQEKFQWTIEQVHDINWPSIQQVMKQLAKYKWQIISKFIHEWLPLKACYHVQSTSTQQLCPLCKQHPETTEHFLQCPHCNRQQLWTKLISHVQKLSFCYNVPLAIRTNLVQGIHFSTSSTNPPHSLDPAHHLYYQHQHHLGWQHIFYSWYSSKWVSTLHQHDPPINGPHFLTKLIVLMWAQILTVWHIHNAHLHPPLATNTDRSWLCNIVQQILYDTQQDPNFKALVGHIQVDQLMSQPTKQIHQFVNWSRDHIPDHNQAAATQACLNTQDICNSFQQTAPQLSSSTTNKNLLWPL